MTGSTIPKSTTEQRTERGRTEVHRPPHAAPGAHAHPGGQKGRPGHVPFQATQDRTEPSWADPSAAPFAASPYSAGESAYASLQASPKRKAMRLMLMAGIFIIGAGAGLVGAWWINEPSVLRTDPVVEAPATTQVVTVRKPVETQSAAKVRGINPSELPYDGAAPPDVEESAPVPAEPVVAKRQAPKVVPPLAEQTPKPPTMPESSGTSAGEPAKSDGAGVAAAEEVPTPPDSGSAGIASSSLPMEGGKDQASIDTDKPEPTPAPLPEAVPPKPSLKAASQAKEGDGKKASITQKRATPTRSAKDREIERIRQQAEDELKKKSESGRLLGRSRGNQPQSTKAQTGREGAASVRTASASERNVRATLARCERASNIFRREQCKWRICGGAWGKNGCPYYPPPQVSNSY